MQTLLIAGSSDFDFDQIAGVLAGKFESTKQDKTGGTGGITLLTLKHSGRFVAQMASCDHEENIDTMDDFQRLEGIPKAFTDALEARSLRFLIVTYEPTEWELLYDAIRNLGAAGVAEFYADATDTVHVLM